MARIRILLALTVAICAIGLATAGGAAASPESQMMKKVNDYRNKHGLRAVKLASNRRVVCGTPDYFDRNGIPRTLEDLAQHNCLAFNLQGGQQRGWYFQDKGKSVIVKQRAKGVLAIGGDITVEGRVSGDVATIGGSIIQRRDAYIGGDIIAFGGAYKPESQTPLREAGKETVMFAMFEDELREMAQNPSEIFAPTFSWAFFAQRILSVLFWFIVSFGLTTLAPGAVSRAIPGREPLVSRAGKEYRMSCPCSSRCSP